MSSQRKPGATSVHSKQSEKICISPDDSFFLRNWYPIWIAWFAMVFIATALDHLVTRLAFLGATAFVLGYGTYDAVVTGKVRIRMQIFERTTNPAGYWLGVAGQATIALLFTGSVFFSTP